jgi:hypothetical protein
MEQPEFRGPEGVTPSSLTCMETGLIPKYSPNRRPTPLSHSQPVQSASGSALPGHILSVLVPRLYSTDLEFVMPDVEPKTDVLAQAGVLPRDILFQPYAAITQWLMDDLSRKYA